MPKHLILRMLSIQRGPVLRITQGQKCMLVRVPVTHCVVNVERKIHKTMQSLVAHLLPRAAPPQLLLVLFVRTMGMNVARHRRATTSMAVVHRLLLPRVLLVLLVCS